MIQTCEVCGTDERVNKFKNEIYLCGKHKQQIVNHGHILERTYKDSNIIETKENHAEIILMDIECNEVGRALVSLSKIDSVKLHNWSLGNRGYVTSRINSRMTTLHKFLKKVSKGNLVDHINRNKLDCRDENLREATPSQNCHNSKIFSSNTSGIKGVRQDPRSGKWSAEICIKRVRYRKHWIGTREEAIDQLNIFKKILVP